MDDDLNAVHKYFNRKVPEFRSLLPPAVVAPAPAVEAPAPRVIPRDAQPPAESSKAKPPKKKVRVEPAPPSDVIPQATAPLMAVDEPAAPSPASGKAPTKPLPVPSSKRAPPPKDAAPVSFRAPSAPRKRRQGKHTAHGASRRAIILTPPADSPVTVASFTPEVINSLNQLLKKDVKSDVVFTHASVEGNGISRSADLPKSERPHWSLPITSMSYLKIVDIPHVPASSKEWALKQHEAFMSALNKSPVGALLAKIIKHKPRFMRASPIQTHAGHGSTFTTRWRAQTPASTFPSLCPLAARTAKSRALARTPAPSIARAVSAGATIQISAAPSAPAAPSALVLTPRPITSSVSTLSTLTCDNAQIVPRLNARRTSAHIPLRTRRSVRFGKIGSIVHGLNASSPRV
ncbi:hypothetical protein Agabi119p4_10562 [Agaricus bisporus var. burnettii]|uniref:Uncharacterized protein n=1 Tax=Agaricus bisporus var. burnettii TaxID=192524 RepID=A0A8H7EWD1_AGABI|nr:hypothetical protein Agabi119p4_10562 [Agaricus bisporus var. burnettii]